jgi:hypothetical protein
MVAVGGEALELSWRSWSGGPDGRADQGFWRRSAPLTIHQASARGLAPGDALLQTVVEALRGARPGLWWIADAMTILSVAADHVDWETLVEEAGRRRIQMPLVAGLEYLQAVFAGPIPVNALEGLRARTPSRLERLEFRHGPVVSRERRMGSRVARIVAEYLRIVSGRSLGAKLAGLPGFLGHRLRARAQGAVTRVFRTSRRASIEAR